MLNERKQADKSAIASARSAFPAAAALHQRRDRTAGKKVDGDQQAAVEVRGSIAEPRSEARLTLAPRGHTFRRGDQLCQRALFTDMQML